jgi:hypothetical protein
MGLECAMSFMAEKNRPGGVREVIAALVANDGSASHPYSSASALLEGADSTRNLADAAHFLCLLHGRYPGVIDHAGERIADPAAREWMIHTTAAFTTERAYLTRLVVAAGPLPSTLGQAQSEAAVTGQTHALSILSQSDRRGTALGAACALAIDWRTVRVVLDAAARRFGLDVPSLNLPPHEQTLAVADAIADTSGIERAIGFGAQQLLVQHRGLWDLLETRQMARRDS